MFTRDIHWNLPWAGWMQFTPWDHISSRPNLTLLPSIPRSLKQYLSFKIFSLQFCMWFSSPTCILYFKYYPPLLNHPPLNNFLILLLLPISFFSLKNTMCRNTLNVGFSLAVKDVFGYCVSITVQMDSSYEARLRLYAYFLLDTSLFSRLQKQIFMLHRLDSQVS